MKFCPSCGTKLVLIQGKQDANIDLDYRCPKCSYSEGLSTTLQEPEVTEPDMSKEAVVIISEEQELRSTPTDRADCSKCHNNLAYVWQVQTRSGDEGPTQFFRCTKCGHTWRLYT